MKTKQEVEQMLKDVQKRIDVEGNLARKAMQSLNMNDFEIHENMYTKLIAQYNILLEVLS